MSPTLKLLVAAAALQPVTAPLNPCFTSLRETQIQLCDLILSDANLR